MKNTISLDPNYSTTRFVSLVKPVITNKTEDHFENLFFLPKSKNRKDEGGLRTKGYFKHSYPDKFLLTIITVVFNGEKHLEETIQSVINQTYDNVEYIIIDGGSIDGTLDIIHKYEHAIDYWVSEKDSGIYEAMNKGIILAQGVCVGLINSGDGYFNNALQIIADTYVKLTDKKTIICGGMQNIDNLNMPLFQVIRTPSILKKKYKMMPLNHPATFVPLSVYKQIGLYSTKYKIDADYEFVLRADSQNISIHFIDDMLTFMRVGGISQQFSLLAYKEEYMIRKQYLGSVCSLVLLINGLFFSAVKIFIPKALKNRLMEYRHGRSERNS